MRIHGIAFKNNYQKSIDQDNIHCITGNDHIKYMEMLTVKSTFNMLVADIAVVGDYLILVELCSKEK